MSIGLRKDTEKVEDDQVGEGIEGLADDIEDLLSYSEAPQRYQDIREHFEEDEKYFEDDLEHLKEALDYLQDQDRVKDDVRLDVEEPDAAYSVKY